ncbi:cupin domain-containing protein [Devosia nitrariae]|uniref:Cupin type-2 domain-containing protein n=1 Tax=Devosia nitrariae TaxID=2071872 RepID=A0ABQ5W0B9_9HYPH|nr:cupin domain-containing protein [Devosia nitrariae]GLQ53355.1 hypothetical protein GCM10010862_06130 [Devosia nitrariae]
MTETDPISKRADGTIEKTSWGQLTWKITGQAMPGAEMTFGTCEIKPGERNALHSHPDCEEILYVVSGTCEHKLGDAIYEMQPGDAIRIPRNVRHWARCTSAEPLLALIIFSSGQRTAVNHEGQDAA